MNTSSPGTLSVGIPHDGFEDLLVGGQSMVREGSRAAVRVGVEVLHVGCSNVICADLGLDDVQ